MLSTNKILYFSEVISKAKQLAKLICNYTSALKKKISKIHANNYFFKLKLLAIIKKKYTKLLKPKYFSKIKFILSIIYISI